LKSAKVEGPHSRFRCGPSLRKRTRTNRWGPGSQVLQSLVE
jgi:hypothetical protein